MANSREAQQTKTTASKPAAGSGTTRGQRPTAPGSKNATTSPSGNTRTAESPRTAQPAAKKPSPGPGQPGSLGNRIVLTGLLVIGIALLVTIFIALNNIPMPTF